MAEKKAAKKTTAKKADAPKKAEQKEEFKQDTRTADEHARMQAERDAANAEHLRRVGGADPERISSAEDTQRQLDAIPNKSPQD